MPMFDLSCACCGWSRDDAFVLRRDTLPPCPSCGQPTHTVWRTSFPSIIDDTILGGETIENLAPTPITFHSRSEKRLYLKMHGISEKVRHVGTPGEGSDKSAHTSRWV